MEGANSCKILQGVSHETYREIRLPRQLLVNTNVWPLTFPRNLSAAKGYNPPLTAQMRLTQIIPGGLGMDYPGLTALACLVTASTTWRTYALQICSGIYNHEKEGKWTPPRRK